MIIPEQIFKQIEPYLHGLLQNQESFSYEELVDICVERFALIGSKTKDENKAKIIVKYLSEMFDIDLIAESKGEISASPKRFQSIPKRLLQGTTPNSQPVIDIIDIEKQLGSTILFEGASLQVHAGDKIALIGKNGAGKSTLLKMILGDESIDSGEITIKKDTTVGFLSQEILRQNPDRTVQEEMLTTLPAITEKMHRLDALQTEMEAGDAQSIKAAEEYAEITDRLVIHNGFVLYDLQTTLLGAFGLTPEQLTLPIHALSGGEQTKLQIAKFLLQQKDILVLDEPTNHLDIEGIQFLEEFCRIWKKTLICISHDKTFLNTSFEQIVEIADHQLFSYKGNYDSYREQKILLHEQQLKTFEQQQKYIQQQEVFINRFRYKDSKAAQVQSRIKQLDKIDKVSQPENVHTAKQIATQKPTKRLPQVLIKIESATIGYDPGSPLCEIHKKLLVEKDSSIGIIGKNGVGKTTLIESIVGNLPLLGGSIHVNSSIKLGFYGQIVESMNSTNTLTQELLGPGINMKAVMSILGSLNIASDKLQQTIGSLSGGEKAKIALTKMLLQNPDVIIMDEPTNHLDILTKESIEMLLQSFQGVSIIISHDRDFLEQVSSELRLIQNKSLTVFNDLKKGFAALME